MGNRKTNKLRRVALSRSHIAEAGLALMDSDGFEGLSMRKLAQVLGVEAMSLYNHVRDKSDLLQDIANLVVAKVDLPDPKKSWRAQVEDLLRCLYQTLVNHPHAVLLLARDQVQINAPRALAVLEAGAAALAQSSLPPSSQVSAFRGLIALTFGFVLAHTRGALVTRQDAQAHWSAWDPNLWDPGSVPQLAKVAPHFLTARAEDDWAFTLGLYLDALERRALHNSQ